MTATQRDGVPDFSLKGLRDCIRGALAAGYAANVRRIAADFLCHPVVNATVERGQTVETVVPILAVACFACAYAPVF